MTGSDGGATIAHPSVEQLGGRSSILFKQRADHARLDRLMDRARATRAACGREHLMALRAVTRLVFSQVFAEESVLFPAARQVLPEGDPLTLHIETAHQQVNELVTCLDASPGDASGHGRDRLQWLDEATSGRWSGRLATADRAFATAAGAVERFRLLQRGERTATRKAAGDSGSCDQADGPQSEISGIGQDHPGGNG